MRRILRVSELFRVRRIRRIPQDSDSLELRYSFLEELEAFPGVHWMMRSARARSDDGMVRPRARAVLALTISSNFCGCSTGRSPGLTPFRILSTYTAARRNKSG